MYLRLGLGLAAAASVMGAILFGVAGRASVWQFWAYIGVLLGSAAVVNGTLSRRSPALLAERMRPPNDRDRATRRMAAPLVLAHWVLAGLDVRYGGTMPPAAAIVAGLVFLLFAFTLVGWTLLVNPFASSAVRIQAERGHRVIARGPYAFVRHPMYLGVVLFVLGSGPALGSWWAGLVLLPILPVFVRRTLVEDRMLQHELPGYADYAARVRWRVVPYVF